VSSFIQVIASKLFILFPLALQPVWCKQKPKGFLVQQKSYIFACDPATRSIIFFKEVSP